MIDVSAKTLKQSTVHRALYDHGIYPERLETTELSLLSARCARSARMACKVCDASRLHSRTSAIDVHLSVMTLNYRKNLFVEKTVSTYGTTIVFCNAMCAFMGPD